ncbi:MAG: YggS family pyridoxal phosphate-dependent enzyme [Deltaproteobacteria bacterium]|nr:YggS family pyridoxal phosphate-dependent enzyme [Deltaproteobacteria bacterium]
MQERLQEIHRRLTAAAARAGREPGSVRLLAVSKGQRPEQILELASCGQRDFGENYVQEWLEKRARITALAPKLASALRWHFIGHLQSNKASLVAGEAFLLHSVDSLKLARKLSASCQTRGAQQPALIEVNLGNEASKSGLEADALLRELQDYAALPGLAWRGLMAIPPALEPAAAVRPYFERLKSLLDECNRTGFFQDPLTELSMGMSQDFEVAVEAGATWVRVGTALFGPRQS